MVGKLIVFILYLIECQCRPNNTTTTPITTTTATTTTTTATAKTITAKTTSGNTTTAQTTSANSTTAQTTSANSTTAQPTSANSTTAPTTSANSTTAQTTTTGTTPTTISYPTPPNVPNFTTTSSTTTSTSTYYPPYKVNDNMGVSDKKKILNLTSDLIVETKLALRQVISIVYDQSSFEGYHYGVLVGKIREEYRSMMEIYKTALNRLAGFNYSLVIPPSSHVVRPIHYIHYMHSANKLERDIEQMVQLMLWIDTGAVTLRPHFHLPGPAIPPLRTRMEVAKKNKERGDGHQCYLYIYWMPREGYIMPKDFSSVKTRLRTAENRVKSRIREAHLMRRLGLPANTSTTKKRFVNRWPVEETWQLNDYETT